MNISQRLNSPTSYFAVPYFSQPSAYIPAENTSYASKHAHFWEAKHQHILFNNIIINMVVAEKSLD